MTKISRARLARTKASARKKRIAALEKAAMEDIKAPSSEHDDGEGSKAKSTAADKYKRDKVNKPKSSGDASGADKNLEGEPAGYPFDGDTDGGLGKGKPKKAPTTKQKALDEANDKRKELTSDTPELASTPKPKLSAAKRKAWRTKRIAQLKSALSQDEAENLDETEIDLDDSSFQAQDITDQASDAQRSPAGVVLKKVKELVPALTQQLTQANDMLEKAIMGNNLQKIKGALAFLLTKIQSVSKNELVPLHATIRKLMSQMSQKTASKRNKKRIAAVSIAHKRFAALDTQMARARQLVRMSAGRITY